MTRIAVFGAGAFGTSLAVVWAQAGRDVTIWGRDAASIAAAKSSRSLEKYLPGVSLPRNLDLTSNLEQAAQADLHVIAVPAQQTREFCNRLASGPPRLVVAKGVETASGQMPHEIADAVAVVSGPGFAAELAAGKPTALSLGCADGDTGAEIQSLLSTDTLRLYLNADINGVALGGALKNVYAIACGLVAGAGLGESARAALMTRGFAEMARLGAVLGAKQDTLMGLSGLGDLALTCTSPQSRNFAYGLRLGGRPTGTAATTVEGIATARAVLVLGRKNGVDLPIAQAVAQVLEGDLSIADAVAALMSRPLKQES
ncbi:MAG: NAD(P)H-dependent glycerol-3-phosphate dehydrogenase [Pseudomonadota bacterium]